MESLLEKQNRGARLQTPVDWHYSFGRLALNLLTIFSNCGIRCFLLCDGLGIVWKCSTWHFVWNEMNSDANIVAHLSIGPKASGQQNLTGFVELFSLVSVDDLCSHLTSQRCGKVINVRETYFCETILADIRVSWVFQIYFNFVPMLESWWVDHKRD